MLAVGDGRPFWRYIVQEATQCTDEAMFEEVYQYYARAGEISFQLQLQPTAHALPHILLLWLCCFITPMHESFCWWRSLTHAVVA